MYGKRTEFRYRKVSGVNEDIYRYNNFIKCISINRVWLNYVFEKNMQQPEYYNTHS